MLQEGPSLRIEMLRGPDDVEKLLRETGGKVVLTIQRPKGPAQVDVQERLLALRRRVEELLRSPEYSETGEVYVDDGRIRTRAGQRPLSIATNPRSGKKIALKRSRPGEKYSEPALQKFQLVSSSSEGKRWFPELLCFQRFGETTYSAHEWRSGITLEELLLEGDQPISLEVYMEHILPEVLSALECLHQHRLIHGDVKLGNFSVDEQGGVPSHDDGSVALFGSIEGEIQVTGPAPPEYSDTRFPRERQFGPHSDAFKLRDFFEVMLNPRRAGEGATIAGWQPAELNGIQCLVRACSARAFARPQSMGVILNRLQQWWGRSKEYKRVKLLTEFHRHNIAIKRKQSGVNVPNAALEDALAFFERLKSGGLDDPRLSAQIATLRLWLSYPAAAAEQYRDATWKDPLNGYHYALDISEARQQCNDPDEAERWRDTAGNLLFRYEDRSQFTAFLNNAPYLCLRTIMQVVGRSLSARWSREWDEQSRRSALHRLLGSSCGESVAAWEGLQDDAKLRAVLRLYARINAVFKEQEKQKKKGDRETPIPKEELEHLLSISDTLLALLPESIRSTDFWLLRGKILHILSELPDAGGVRCAIYASAASETHDHALKEAPPGDPAVAQCLKFYMDTGHPEKVRVYADEMMRAVVESPLIDMERRIAFEQDPDCQTILAACAEDDREAEVLLYTSCAIDSSHIAAHTAIILKALEKRPRDLAAVAAHAPAVLCQDEQARKYLSDQLARAFSEMRDENIQLSAEDEQRLIEIYQVWNSYIHGTPRKVLGLLACDLGLGDLEHAIEEEEARKTEHDRLRRIEAELKLVGELQRSSLTEVSTIPGAEIEVLYQPTEHAGGDGYWFHELSDGSVAIVVYDESGHGTHAAIRQVITSERLSANAHELDKGVRAFANAVNASFPKQEYFTTAVFTILDARKKELRFVNYGHGLLRILRGGTVHDPTKEQPQASTLPLKVADAQPRTTGTFNLKAGDRLVYYVDGWSDAVSGDGVRLGFAGFDDLLKETRGLSPGDAKQTIYDLLRSRGYVIKDDITLVIVDILENQG
jgi:serine phosphatase RsbU (regulator of sigma subunit)